MCFRPLKCSSLATLFKMRRVKHFFYLQEADSFSCTLDSPIILYLLNFPYLATLGQGQCQTNEFTELWMFYIKHIPFINLKRILGTSHILIALLHIFTILGYGNKWVKHCFIWQYFALYSVPLVDSTFPLKILKVCFQLMPNHEFAKKQQKSRYHRFNLYIYNADPILYSGSFRFSFL